MTLCEALLTMCSRIAVLRLVKAGVDTGSREAGREARLVPHGQCNVNHRLNPGNH